MRHPWSSQQFAQGSKKAGISSGVVSAAQIAAERIKAVNPDLPVIFSLEHLCHLSDVSFITIRSIVNREEDPYRVFRVKKRFRSGRGSAAPRKYRTICVPSPVLMRLQRWIAQNILNVVAPHELSYAFAPKKDLYGAASRHRNSKWLVKIDVRHFFESILESRIFGVFSRLGYGQLLSFEMARICTRVRDEDNISRSASRGRMSGFGPYPNNTDGHLPQGAPTSPMLANLAVFGLDEKLEALAKNYGWTYTRYADDLAFSISSESTRGRAQRLAILAERELVAFGLKVNRQKTSITSPRARKVLLGLLVDREQPRLTRSYRNNVETHLYALTSSQIGATAHRKKRGFSSTIGMRRHIAGLIAYAHRIDRDYAAKLYSLFNAIDWSR